ncbi:hypothetical protein [Pedobacter xixiisoli]|uniref:Uncharacterized protein n=1 Tax=Pedobacter xixiisoli TaxID=1476464 RepID=A0A285ZZV3_9SPHI|nr:hypothetical protein [Pedobacter xixiisoli]SOD15170.1 hypothetical protein SAMN06297358_2146 [Pedobacter xixiisoli]
MKTLNLKNTLFLIAVLLTFSAIFQACKKDKTRGNSARNAREFTALFGPQAQQKLINTGESNTFTLLGGTKITIPPNAFKINGVPVTGNVVITAGEFLKRSDVVFSGTNTNHISGAPLESDGFIFLNAAANGTNVDKQLAANIQIAIPTTNTRATQIWEGIENIGNVNQMAWQPLVPNPNGVAGVPRESNPINGFYNFQMGNLGWMNCDVFYSMSNPKTTVRVTIANNPGSFATFMGFTGETFVFFCAKGSNVVAQFYNPDGVNTLKSYDDIMPIGAEGKYISFSIKDGKYYYAEQATTITASQHITLTLAETTETAIQQAINSLNTY